MRSKISGIVVDFIGETEGTVVAHGTQQNPIGSYSRGWYAHTNNSRWYPYNGSKAQLMQRKLHELTSKFKES